MQGLDDAVVYDQLRQLVRGMRLVVPFEPSPVPIAHGVLVDHLPAAAVRLLRHYFLCRSDFHAFFLFKYCLIVRRRRFASSRKSLFSSSSCAMR